MCKILYIKKKVLEWCVDAIQLLNECFVAERRSGRDYEVHWSCRWKSGAVPY